MLFFACVYPLIKVLKKTGCLLGWERQTKIELMENLKKMNIEH